MISPGLAELVVVDLAHRDQLGRGAAEEDLVGQVELGARDVALDDRDSRGRSAIWITDLRLIPSRIEAVCPGVDDLAVADDEDVLARALADEAALVEQDRLVVAGVGRLGLGEDRVQVLARRPSRAGSARPARSAARRRPWRGCPCACPPRRGRRPTARPRSITSTGADVRVEAHLAVAAEGERADVAAAQARCGGSARGWPRAARPRASGRAAGSRARPTSRSRSRWSRWRKIAGPLLGLVAADPLEDAGAVVQAVAEHVDLGVVPGDELPVHPDPARTSPWRASMP